MKRLDCIYYCAHKNMTGGWPEGLYRCKDCPYKTPFNPSAWLGYPTTIIKDTVKVYGISNV